MRMSATINWGASLAVAITVLRGGLAKCSVAAALDQAAHTTALRTSGKRPSRAGRRIRTAPSGVRKNNSGCIGLPWWRSYRKEQPELSTEPFSALDVDIFLSRSPPEFGFGAPSPLSGTQKHHIDDCGW